jgi:hypothetical protein
MGVNPVAKRLSRGCGVFLFEIDEVEIAVHEADDPNTVVDLLIPRR